MITLLLLAASVHSFEPLFDARIDYGIGRNPFSVFSTDLDGDSNNDLAVANHLSDNVSILFILSVCIDTDGDGYGDPGYPENTCPGDNCATVYNPDQEDIDADSVGDSCENCVDVYNSGQAETSGDGVGDACCCFAPGNVHGNGGVNVADLTYLVN